ncbi:MAG: leucyl aminopeptidase [Pseudomonadota bacterium]
MKFTLKQGKIAKKAKSCQIIGVSEKGDLTIAAKAVDKASKALITKLFKQGDFRGELGQTWLIPMLNSGTLLLVGCGKTLTVTAGDFRKIINASFKEIQSTHIEQVTVALEDLIITDYSPSWKVRQIVEVANSALYVFDQFKSAKKAATHLKEITISCAGDKTELAECQRALAQGRAIAESVSFAKNLENLPSNICTPTFLAEQAKEFASQHKNITIKILEEAEMKKLGMGAFMAVTSGSAQPGKMVCLEYTGTDKKSAPIGLVGKGITFDSGGISLKPPEAMISMKYDMCGAATVLGVFKAATLLKLPINLVGIMAIAENLPSGTACKPDDIVTTLSGITVEILNTDAEGRLVLSDALTYCERYKPKIVIDIATLTGAAVIALGHHASALLTNDDELAQDLLTAGLESYDRAWRLPLWSDYQEQIKSPFADIANTGGRTAGTITAACFLSRFTKKFRWAHLDVAGTAAMMMGGADRYATGRPIPMLTQFLINQCND